METRAVDPRLASVLGEMVTQLRPTQRDGIYIYALYIPRMFGDDQSGDEFADFGERADDWFRLVDPAQPKDRWVDLSHHDQVSRLLRNTRSDSLYFQSADVSDSAVSALRSEFERQEQSGLTSHRLQWACFWSLVFMLAATTICTTRAFFRRIRATNDHQLLTSVTGWPVLVQLGLVATGMAMVVRQDAYALLVLLVPVVLLILLAEMSATVIALRRQRHQP